MRAERLHGGWRIVARKEFADHIHSVRFVILVVLVALAGLASVVFIVRVWKNRPAPALADGIQPLHGAELERYRDQADKETDL